MSLIMFVVGGCLGIVLGSGLVTWANLSDSNDKEQKFIKEVETELDRLTDEVRGMGRR